MVKNKKIITISSIVAVILLTILIVGTIFDLQISKALADISNGQYYSSNIFAIIGEWFGEDILYLFIIGACAILFFYLLKFPLNKKYLTITSQVLVCVISYLVSLYSFYKMLRYIARYLSSLANDTLTNYISSAIGIITILIIPVVICIAIFFIISKLKPETLKALWKWAIIVLAVAVISNGIVQVSKHIFDRTRFRAMVFAGDEEFRYFTNWFNINSNKTLPDGLFASDYYKSFPSGHTCAGASTFLIVLLPYYLQELNNKKSKIILWTIASIYTFLVALSRIVAGAHFFTDVYIATLITVITIFVVYIVFSIIIKKYKPLTTNPNSTETEGTKEIENNENKNTINNKTKSEENKKTLN